MNPIKKGLTTHFDNYSKVDACPNSIYNKKENQVLIAVGNKN